MQDLAGRLASRVQLTSDGHSAYLSAVEDAFGADIDYAMLIKHYGNAPEGQRRYSPAVCTGATKVSVSGVARASSQAVKKPHAINRRESKTPTQLDIRRRATEGFLDRKASALIESASSTVP